MCSTHVFNMYVFVQICYQHVILSNFHVLAAIDFLPPGGHAILPTFHALSVSTVHYITLQYSTIHYSTAQ